MTNPTSIAVKDASGATQTVSTLDAALAALALDTSVQTLITNSAAAIPAGSNLIGGVNGPIASGQTGATTNPFRAAFQARTTNVSAKASGVVADAVCTAIGALITRPYAIPETEWSTGASPITLTTSAQALVIAAGAGLLNYMTEATITTNATFTANTLQFKQGTTVVWEIDLPAGAGLYHLQFPTPIKTAANAALNVIATGAVTGTCKINASGYQAP